MQRRSQGSGHARPSELRGHEEVARLDWRNRRRQCGLVGWRCVGAMTAAVASAVGTGAGLYLGWWIAERLLD